MSEAMEALVGAFELARMKGDPDELPIARHKLLTAIAALEAQNAAMRRAGSMLSNCAFNLAQPTVVLTPECRLSLKKCQERWDAAVTSPSPTGP